MTPLRNLALLALPLLAACDRSAEGANGRPDTPTPVRVADVIAAGDGASITATGALASKDEVTLSFKIGGIVSRVLVDEGATVRAGQVLAVLDLREIDALVAKATAGAEKARRDAARAERLFHDSVATIAQMQDAQTALAAAEADLRAARVNHEFATIKAPTAGVVLMRMGNPGQLVGAGTPVIQFGSSARGKVLRVGLSDREAMRLRSGPNGGTGAPARITFDAVPGKEFKGRVSQVAAAADPRTGTYTVEIAVEGVASLPSGLVGRVTIAGAAPVSARRGDPTPGRANGALVYSIPAEALVDGDSAKGIVFTVDAAGKRARRVPVTLVSLRGDFVLVRGLDGVSRVVTAGATWLTDSGRVEIKP